MGKKKHIVCLDAGHGGDDPGAVHHSVNHKLEEEDVVLNVVLSAREQLERMGFKVVLTRDSDVFHTLSKRAQIANEAKADIFVSVHCNSADNQKASGIETYAMPKSIKGEKLASAIQDAMLDEFPDRIDRGVKKKAFAVLRRTAMAASLVELEFIHSISGATHLAKPETQLKCSKAIVQGVLDYFNVEESPVLPELKGDAWKDHVLNHVILLEREIHKLKGLLNE